MRTWLPIVVLLVGVLAAGMLRERWRIAGMQKWAGARGLRLHSPFAPGERPPMAMLAGRFIASGARIWGVGLDGALDGGEVTIAEHETANIGPKTTGVWHILVAWPVSPRAGTVLVAKAPLQLAPTTFAVEQRLGLEGSDPALLRSIDGGLLVEGLPEVRDAFLTESRRADLLAWLNDGELVRDGEWAAWRFRGNLTPAVLDRIAPQLPEARRLLE